MKNLFYGALLLFFNYGSAFGQIVFENGYFINNKGEKTEVLIKNYQWKNSPSVIEYKNGEKENTLQIKTSDLLEFSVGDQKYLMANVMIDRSSVKIEDMSNSKSFNSKEETLLLKQLVKGKISLYKYTDGSVVGFFYKKENDDIFKSLNYKEYLVNGNLIQKNEEYKIKLAQEFSDNEKVTPQQINNLHYNDDSLEKIFKVYNNINNEKNQAGKNFHIYIKPSVGFSRYDIERSQTQLFGTLDSNSPVSSQKTNSMLYRISAEFEYVFNFNKGKWAIISEPTFQTTQFNVSNYLNTNFDVKYSSIQIPVGLKHNMFLNKKSKIYVSASLYYQFLLNKDIFTTNDSSASGLDTVSQSFAIGYNYDRFGAELRWGATPNFKTYYDGAYYGLYFYSHSTSMDGFNLSLSYKLF
ncbi:hypothetical protein [Chryseobacterium caseinilyticum]|uniref:Outer membrane protein beta-barrel domain-containing protein n=1 Tax=Chryseobacterium caseinilyticum TaxID=2771428 RepID=A0ABR8ZA36_9FLAO|nr:hypothetical protein [Chryseobacterium caseinilyticum]MBD8082096.1 hypothetical protein [Chryseobacterium caseinilyticum]